MKSLRLLERWGLIEYTFYFSLFYLYIYFVISSQYMLRSGCGGGEKTKYISQCVFSDQ